jgi:Cu(I)/Ag(I) efflux system membrane protein CusA/SilA
LQDWFLKFELKTIPNVAEVASVGGVVKQYQIQVNPLKLAQYGISLSEVKQRPCVVEPGSRGIVG